jgi:hypothetical protein
MQTYMHFNILTCFACHQQFKVGVAQLVLPLHDDLREPHQRCVGARRIGLYVDSVPS